MPSTVIKILVWYAISVLLVVADNHCEQASPNSTENYSSVIEEINSKYPTHLPDSRIVNGHKVPKGKRLFQVAMFRRGRFSCGGSLISRRFVLTAAHCVRNVNPNHLEIRFGTHTYKNGPKVQVESVLVHPYYNPYTVRHDLAMLRLALPVPRIANKVDYVQLNIRQNPFAGSVALVSGWGRTGRYQRVSDQLLMTQLELVNKSICQQQWSSAFNVHDGMLCATDSRASACHGDSGGPLTTRSNIQIGVVSLGAPNCYSGFRPNVYTNVYYYRDWIRKVLQTDF